MNIQHKQKAFTLVELAVVIVIIGLIVAGVTAGNLLVQQARIRQLMTEMDKFQSAFTAFKLQYGAMPGDIKNASSYWTGSPDGNGNRNWDTWDATNNTEYYGTWNHLAKAGLIEGSYTGVKGSGPVAGVNIPPCPVKGCIYYLSYDGVWQQYPFANILVVEKLLVSVVSNIDTKIDDGKPYVGKIIGYGSPANAGSPNNHLWTAGAVNGIVLANKQNYDYDFSQPTYTYAMNYITQCCSGASAFK